MNSEAEAVVAEDLVTCGRCGGEGEESYEEDGRPVTDPCYHCAGSGVVSSEVAFHDRVAAAASVLASRWVSEFRKSADNDPDGDGFGLSAAENGLSASDYAREMVLVKTEEFGRELAGLSHHLQVALVDELVPEVAPVVTPVMNLLTSPAFTAALIAECHNDEIPF